MDLEEYRWRKRTSYAAMARELNCSPHHLNRIALKKYKPGISLAHRIEQITNGEVTVKELLNVDKEHSK